MSLHDTISELATTNLRIACSLMMILALFIVWLTGTMLHRIGPNELESLKWLALVVSIWAGLDVTQFWVKRATFEPDVHATPMREDASPPPPAGAATQPPAIAAAATPQKDVAANTPPQRALTSEGLPRPIRAG